MKAKTCPFCGGGFNIVCIDENDNMNDAEYLEDYPEERYKHDWSFGITHDVFTNPTCPIATVGRNELIGGYEYDSVETAIIAINRRVAE